MINSTFIFKIFDGLFLVLIVYLIWMLAMNLFNNVPIGFQEIVIALLVANIGYTFYIKDRVQDIERKMKK